MMKKLYLFLLTIILGGTLSYIYFLNSNSGRSFFGKDVVSNEYRLAGDSYKESKEAGKPDEYSKYFNAITTKFGKEKSDYPLNYRVKELNTAIAKSKMYKQSSKASTITWTQRGPANVGGRTRGLIIDPDDATNNTWFAGAATGGIWKTTDGGETWTCLTDGIANLATVTIAMAESNHEIIYAGTGEVVGGSAALQGSGIFKSTDRGENWTQLTSTISDDFQFVNRLIISPADANIVIAATNAGIMKTTDGGNNWNKVYSSSSRMEDIDADPTDFNKIYSTEYGIGVVKSTDAGETWNLAIDGLEQGSRYELAISPDNPAKIYLSINSTLPMAYRSTDYGATWQKFKIVGTLPDLLGQGDYDNIIAVHPYDEDVVFIGGVNIYKLDFSDPGTTSDSDPFIYRVDLFNTSSFMDFINFGGTYLNGGMETGDNNNAISLTDNDFVSVEIRFGAGKSQMAHRFTVGGAGSGVPASSYIYKDYVEVPFEVWDVTNNKQLMASFRDQEEDNVFNLIERDPADDAKGREYLFVNAVDYNASAPSSDIAKDGGHSYKQLYFFWPTLAEGGIWDDAALPESKISISYGSVIEVLGTNTIVADAYGSVNNYNQSAGYGTTKIPGLHPDHHNLIMIKTDEANEKFTIINANDGGLAISEDEGATFNQLPNNYITTQFYGVAKKPNANEYIGGMQDNGTWATPDGENSSSTTDYIFHIGGDGFECVWNPEDDQKIIGSVYYNSFRKTTNGGSGWISGYNGIETVAPFGGESHLDGPFISRISYNKNNPDVLFAVGYNGIYKTTDFATNWNKITLDEGWNSEYWVENEYVSSQHNIEVSLANENIVWAGAAMSTANGWSIFVSTDQGETFNTVAEFDGADLSGYVSGIATHPTEDSTAYLLFSFAGEPKVIRTKDLGQTWEDLSGFVGNSSSDNGFPDVVTHCLVVLPNDLSTIWVGTDIGLFESTDDGISWHYVDSDLPAVSVYDMFVQDGQVVIATHGRGIWTASIEELNYYPELKAYYEGFQTISIDVSFISAADSIKIYVNNEFSSLEETIVSGLNSFEVPATSEGVYKIKVHSYKDGTEYSSPNMYTSVNFSPAIAVAKVSNENSIEFTGTFIENYDSVQTFVNSTYKTSVIDPLTDFDEVVDLTASGNYTCYIDAYIGGNAYKSNEVELSFTYTGLNFADQVHDLKVYPNPTTGIITIDLPDNFNSSYKVQVYSLSGSQMYTASISKSNNRMNLNKLKEGLYIIRIENNGEIYSQKIQLKR